MDHLSSAARTVLHADGATVELALLEDQGYLQIRSAEAGAGARAGARLVGEAVHEARSQHVRSIRTVLQAAPPACGIVLDELRRRMGQDVETLDLRRAGSSVLVTVGLRPQEVATGSSAREALLVGV